MAYSAIPTRTSTDTNASADINQLQDNIQGAAMDGVYSNAIINGEMRIAQRGTSFAAAANADYTLDRWRYGKNGEAVQTISQSTEVPSSDIFDYSLRMNTTTEDETISADNFVNISQRIEGNNFWPYLGKTFKLSFWVRSSVSGNYCLALTNNAQDRSYVTVYNISEINTWQKVTLTIPHNATGTWETGTASGVQIWWTLAAGSTYQTTADTWAAGFYLSTSLQQNAVFTAGNDFYLTGVKLSLNDIDTTPRSYEKELELCLR